jgi:adenine-specific DNA-methyltransferase
LRDGFADPAPGGRRVAIHRCVPRPRGLLLHAADAIGVASANAGNVLTASVLKTLPLPEEDFSGPRVVYAEGCTVPDDRLVRHGVTFKQIPYQIEGL